MQDVSKGEGRTVLFVSHNMAAVKSLCTRGMLIEKGQVKMIGDTDEVLAEYLTGESSKLNFQEVNIEKMTLY